MSDIQEHFKDVEIEHDLTTYYATGSVGIEIRDTTGGSFEGYDFERLSECTVESITISELYYIDENIDDAVQVLGKYKYKEVEQLAKEAITDMYN